MKELTQDRTDDELVGALVAAFGISESQARSDVKAFVEALDSGGLLEQPVAV